MPRIRLSGNLPDLGLLDAANAKPDALPGTLAGFLNWIFDA